MNKKIFNITKGHHYSLLETKNYGEIVFGCPPDIVKEFMKAKKPLPSKYVFPSKTFNNGQNHFDFEFIIYSFLFTRAKESIVHAYCRPAQERQIRAILNETLFGPRFDQIIEA
ncbi:MAG: MBL fold metallo-hydrolase, partial [Nitrospinaceae bacterium]